MKRSITGSSIIHFYRKLGVDVERLIPDGQLFELLLDDHGVLRWTPSITGDERFYQDLSKIPWYYSKHKKEFEYASSIIEKRSKVLEIGCGNGYFQDYAKLEDYTGLEFNSDALLAARKKGYDVRSITYQQASIEMHEKYDVVCSFQVLEHLSDYASYFKSSYDLLKAKGLLITSVPSEDSIFGESNNVLNAPPHHVTRWSDSALTTVAEVYGFECVDTIHLPIEHYHAKWFFNILFQRGFSADDKQKSQANAVSRSLSRLFVKFRLRMLWAFLKILGFSTQASVNSLPISGHTVISICRKRETSG